MCDTVQINNTYREMDNSVSNTMEMKSGSTKNKWAEILKIMEVTIFGFRFRYFGF
jgi:hypothetical protein